MESPLFQQGLKDGLPICLGYISVAFTFGMMATEGGLAPWSSLLISMTNLTSAGQFAGTALILSGGTLLEIAVTTFVINIRYMLMSLSLSQKLDPDMKMAERLILSFGVTDEVFAVAIRQRKELTARYLAGLILTPYAGWALGTVLGATATGVLPLSVRSALGIAIYGMFIAIIIPPEPGGEARSGHRGAGGGPKLFVLLHTRPKSNFQRVGHHYLRGYRGGDYGAALSCG